MNHLSTIASTVSPETRLAAANLRSYLSSEGDFSTKAIVAIVAHALEHGTLDDAPFVRPDEAARLVEVFIRGFPEVDYDSGEWDADSGHWTPNDALPAATEAITLQFWALEDPRWDDTRLCPCGRTTEAEPCKCEPLPPIAGGCDDIPAEYSPSPEDWADYNAWSDQIERAREWYRQHPLSEINALRTDD